MYPIWILDCPTLLFSLNLYVITIDYFEEINKLILKFIWMCKIGRNDQFEEVKTFTTSI